MAHPHRKHTQRRQKARAQRRAKRAQKRRSAAGPRSAGPRMLVSSLSPASPGGTTTFEMGAGADMATQLRYLEAHQHLPWGFPWPGCDVEGTLQAALDTLARPMASGEAILEAIMLLAHIPDRRALDSLRRYGASAGVHSDMARLGEDECAMWIREQSAIAAPTLN